MSIERVRAYLQEFNAADRIMELSDSSATVELAALALGTQPERIAKTLSFMVDEKAVLIVMAGDAKIDNRKYKDQFSCKAKMLKPQEAENLVGHAPGGVCPFGVKEGVTIYLDDSLKRFETVFPAAGNGHSAIELTISELEQFSKSRNWICVTKGWE